MMEFLANRVLYIGPVGAGALISSVMYPSFPLPQMTNLTDWAHCK